MAAAANTAAVGDNDSPLPAAGTARPPSASSRPSQRSSASLAAQRLAAQALHARRIADLEAQHERAAMERERAVANIELEAELAALDESASLQSSFKSSMIDKWVTGSTLHNLSLSEQIEPPRPVQEPEPNAPCQRRNDRNLPAESAEDKRVASPGAACGLQAAAREHAPYVALTPSTSAAARFASGDRCAPFRTGVAATAVREAAPAVMPSGDGYAPKLITLDFPPLTFDSAPYLHKQEAPVVPVVHSSQYVPYQHVVTTSQICEPTPILLTEQERLHSLAATGQKAVARGRAPAMSVERGHTFWPGAAGPVDMAHEHVSNASTSHKRTNSLGAAACELLTTGGHKRAHFLNSIELAATTVAPTFEAQRAYAVERAPRMSGAAALPSADVLDGATTQKSGCMATRSLDEAAELRFMPSTQHAPPFIHNTHTATHTLGTRDANNCNKNNIDAHVYHTPQNQPSDIVKLAEVIKDLACSSGKVREVNLPVFSGSPMHWLTFRSCYLNSKNSFSATENIGRLSNALRGAARDSVVPLLALSQDPDEVMGALQEQFGQPELLIRHLVSEVKVMPRLSASLDGGKELHLLACTVRNCVHSIKMLNSIEFLASPELLQCVLSKLTPLLREKWVDYAFVHSEYERKFKLELLSDFLTHQSRVHLKFGIVDDMSRQKVATDKARTHAASVSLEHVDSDECYATSGNAAMQRRLTVAPSAFRNAELSTKVKLSKPAPPVGFCRYCHKADHSEVAKCAMFLSLSIEDRWRWVKQNKICHRCLQRGGHFYRRCKVKCEVKNCKVSGHHTILHTEPTDTATYNLTDDQADQAVVAHACSDSAISADLPPLSTPLYSLLKVIPVTISGPKGNMDVHALLDDGSTITLVDQKVADAVGAQGPKGFIRVNCIGGLSKESEVDYVDLHVRGKNCSDIFLLKGVRSVPDIGIASQTVRTKDLTKFAHFKDLVSELSYENAKPMLLIGIDNWHLSIPQSIRRGSRGQPAAVQTALGWTVFGKLPSKHAESVYHSSVVEMEALIKEQYSLDSIGIIKKDLHSVNDERALKILEETSRRLPSGRFETGLLWRADIKAIPDSYNMALSRFIGLERKFKKDSVYAEAYRQYMDRMVENDYAELCSDKPPQGNLWYLPHFGVYHPQKRKLRLVHDAAARCFGVSLNSLLLPGPDLLQPLLAILMRFREGKIALNGDIREMFPQTKIRDQDRDAQRFLWRGDPSLPLQQYRMSSMIFGATSSPCTAIFLKNKNALEHKDKYPEAVEAIIKDHYMDDYLGSVDDPDHAAQLASDIIKVHEAACLEMRSWVSNDPKALVLLRPEVRAVDTTEVGLGPLSPAQVRILGVAWNINDDTLTFRKTHELPSRLTKRVVLSHLMRVYDPLGFLLPIVIAGRIIFQETWRMGIDWDEELPIPAKLKWQAWFESLAKVSANVTIPRCYQTKSKRESQLHVLADASELAYACVAYWRFVCDDESVELAFIGGKARLAPLKPASIPRLELQAALMAARFATYILSGHRISVSKVIFWTDSLTVLKWLHNDARAFKPFVAHRVGEILETTDVSDWKYVPTALNVADDATRGQCSLSSSSRWFKGPKYLFSNPDEWPCEP